MNRQSIFFKAAILLMSFFAAQSYAVEPDLVLVAAKDSSILKISPEEVRRLYLGIPVESRGHLIKPLINATDTLVQEIFMQQVLFMSTEAYRRQALSNTYRTGTTPVPVYTDIAALVAALKLNPNAVTYMLRATALAQPDLKIIGQLWHDQD